MTTHGYAHRPEAMGCRGVVASAHPLASLAGVEILKAGGTVADAAIATNAILAVTQPNMCGLGGDFFCLYREAGSGRVTFLNGAGRSAAAASAEHIRRQGLEAIPRRSAFGVSVPGCVQGWEDLRGRYGRFSLDRLLEPAITYAEEGFPLSPFISQAIETGITTFPDRHEWRRTFLPEGRTPGPGEIFRQPNLAHTLRLIAREGPEVFYRGEIAQRIATAVQGYGGWLTLADLVSHAGEWGEPIQIDYRGYTVRSTPPPTQGLALLQVLNLLEGFDLAALPYHAPEHIHLMVETTRIAFADRNRYVADPAFAEVPVKGLLAKSYATLRRGLYNPGRARLDYPWGSPEGDTTGFCVADGKGNIVAAIQSLFTGFGTGIVPEGTGFSLHARGSYFSMAPGHPNFLEPRKRPFHTLIASLVTRDNWPVMALATMGADGQPQTHAQVLTNVLDFGMGIQEAIERPRWLAGRYIPGEDNELLTLETRVPEESRRGLEGRGHRLNLVGDWSYNLGHAQGVLVRWGGEAPALFGGADPRGDGVAIAF